MKRTNDCRFSLLWWFLLFLSGYHLFEIWYAVIGKAFGLSFLILKIIYSGPPKGMPGVFAQGVEEPLDPLPHSWEEAAIRFKQ